MVKVVVKIESLDKDTGDQGLRDLADDANRKKGNGWTDGKTTTFEVFNHLMPMDVAQYVISKQGEVCDFPLCIEITSGDDLVPAGTLGATGVDDEGEEFNRTWNQWLSPNCFIFERGGKKFVNTASCVDHPQGYIPMSKLTPVFPSLWRTTDLPPEEFSE